MINKMNFSVAVSLCLGSSKSIILIYKIATVFDGLKSDN